MSAVASDTAWQAEALRLKAEGMESKDIAGVVGKSASTVRKVIARATTESEGGWDFPPNESEPDGDGPSREEVHDKEPTWVPPSGWPPAPAEPTPGQQTIDGDEVPHHENDKAADFRIEAGEPVGPMPPREPEGAGEVTYIEKPRIDGTQQVAFDFGGELADDGTLTFTGTFPSGFFEKGDVISGSFKARVVGVAGKDKLDKKSGTFNAAPQAHVALITVLKVD